MDFQIYTRGTWLLKRSVAHSFQLPTQKLPGRGGLIRVSPALRQKERVRAERMTCQCMSEERSFEQQSFTSTQVLRGDLNQKLWRAQLQEAKVNLRRPGSGNNEPQANGGSLATFLSVASSLFESRQEDQIAPVPSGSDGVTQEEPTKKRRMTGALEEKVLKPQTDHSFRLWGGAAISGAARPGVTQRAGKDITGYRLAKANPALLKRYFLAFFLAAFFLAGFFALAGINLTSFHRSDR